MASLVDDKSYKIHPSYDETASGTVESSQSSNDTTSMLMLILICTNAVSSYSSTICILYLSNAIQSRSLKLLGPEGVVGRQSRHRTVRDAMTSTAMQDIALNKIHFVA